MVAMNTTEPFTRQTIASTSGQYVLSGLRWPREGLARWPRKRLEYASRKFQGNTGVCAVNILLHLSLTWAIHRPVSGQFTFQWAIFLFCGYLPPAGSIRKVGNFEGSGHTRSGPEWDFIRSSGLRADTVFTCGGYALGYRGPFLRGRASRF